MRSENAPPFPDRYRDLYNPKLYPMAKFNAPFSLDGSLSGMIVYRRKDIPRVLVRSKGTISKERMYRDPAFTNILRHATEGGGRSQAARALRRVLHPLEPVRDHNWQSSMTGALTAVQHRDTTSPYGQRAVLLSQHGHLLGGLCLSRKTPFDTLLRTPLAYELARDTLSARLEVPALEPDVSFFARDSYPYFRVVAVLGIVPDLFFSPGAYTTDGDYDQLFPQAFYSDWHPTKAGAPALTIELNLPGQPPGNSLGLVLAAGIVMGVVGKSGTVEAAGYAGSGKILEVA